MSPADDRENIQSIYRVNILIYLLTTAQLIKDRETGVNSFTILRLSRTFITNVYGRFCFFWKKTPLWTFFLFSTFITSIIRYVMWLTICAFKCKYIELYHSLAKLYFNKSAAYSRKYCAIITARIELRMVLFLALSVCAFLFLYEIYREPL